MHESNRTGINQNNGSSVQKPMINEEKPIEKTNESKSDAEVIFPALQKYKNEHNSDNLKKLCAEIIEFCRSVYASTKNDEERKIYFAAIQKLNN